MFNSITGTLTGKDANSICIDTHGVEWQITTARPEAFGSVGERAKVFTWLLHTDTAMTLFGFADEDERRLFLDLTKVDGIGPRAAVKILSHIEKTQLVAALDSGNTSAIEKIPGVGKKTAAKMMLTLKGKLTIPVETQTQKRDVPFGDVVDSLCSMGYDRRDCESVVTRLTEKLKSRPDWETTPPTKQEDTIFRMALVELAR